MKKLFFLCAFLFISMQIQAQLCVVKTYDGNQYFHIDIYHSGETEPTQYTFNEDSFQSNYIVEMEQTIINILGGIMSDGYELIRVKDLEMIDLGGETDNYYYLSAP